MNKRRDVGYKKPPSEHRFKPGRSGNPRGRPKKDRSTLIEVVTNELDRTVTLNEGGKKRVFTKRQLIGTQIVNRAAKGEPWALRVLLSMLGSAESVGAADHVSFVIGDPEAVLQRYRAERGAREAAGRADPDDWERAHLRTPE